MKIFFVIPVLLLFVLAIGCKDSSSGPAESSHDSTLLTFVINAKGVHDPRQGEKYVLWLRFAQDSVWQPMKQLTIRSTSAEDTATLVGSFEGPQPVDSITGILVCFQPANTDATLQFPLLEAHDLIYNTGTKSLFATLDHAIHIGDYSALAGSLVFTSTSTDTLAYIHEYYLMNLSGTAQSPSLSSLKVPPEGWMYGLWATDSSFTPHQNFFYGLFSNPSGHDSDSLRDFYPYPGGWKPQAMNVPSGNIIVTLEPLCYGDSLKYKGPSPFTLLEFKRIRYIDKDRNYPMTNVSSDGLPSGWISFR
ncbi:MAG: hypothetical protein Q8916_03585 [Bacteroidota bacterium]|nr:hypothetical protein [Bacteroidota bacterium]MDP4229469.1 hypothetical protein [Bacteroidota bacterium]MDP4236665.1 hypothetical protein [Bacteroidota bacterium]